MKMLIVIRTVADLSVLLSVYSCPCNLCWPLPLMIQPTSLLVDEKKLLQKHCSCKPACVLSSETCKGAQDLSYSACSQMLLTDYLAVYSHKDDSPARVNPQATETASGSPAREGGLQDLSSICGYCSLRINT